MDSAAGSLARAITELEGLQSRRDLQFPATYALVYFMGKAGAGRIDEEAISALKVSTAAHPPAVPRG